MPITDWIKDEDGSSIELLNICHTTQWKFFEKILEEQYLKKEFPSFLSSSVPKWKAVYLYYGFPFYVPKMGDDSLANTEFLDEHPIGILFNPSSITKLQICYPFDTGAFFYGMFKEVLDIEDDELENFELEIKKEDDLKKLIKRYFSSNDNYRRGKIDFTDNAKDGKEQKLISLYTFSGLSRFDSRARAIELHSNENLHIKNIVDAVILPKNRSEEYPDLKEKIRGKLPAAEILEYDEVRRFGPIDARHYLGSATLNFYKTKRML